MNTRPPLSRINTTIAITSAAIIIVSVTTAYALFPAEPVKHADASIGKTKKLVTPAESTDTAISSPAYTNNPQRTKSDASIQPTVRADTVQPTAPAPSVIPKPIKQTCPGGSYEIGYDITTGIVACHLEPSGCPFYEQTYPKGCYPPAGVTCTDQMYTDCTIEEGDTWKQ